MTWRKTPQTGKRLALDTAATYNVGKLTVTVDRIFRKENAKTLGDIILKLMKKEAETPDR